MKFKIRFALIVALFILLPLVFVYSDGTDSMGNYVAGTGAGENLETDSSGNRAANNTFVGPYAGQSDTTGSGNTSVGYGSLRDITTARGCIGLGVLSGQGNTTSNHKLYIHTFYYPAYGIFGDFSTGYFGVNTTSPSSAWTVSGTATNDTTASARFLGSINGSASDAVFSSSVDKDTGLYFLATSGNRLGITAKGTAVTVFDSTGTTTTGTAASDTTTSNRFLSVINGAASDAVFSSSVDKDTGLYFLATSGNRLGITAKGAQVAVFDSSGVSIDSLKVGNFVIYAAADSTLVFFDGTETKMRDGIIFGRERFSIP